MSRFARYHGIAPIDPARFIMFRIISEDRATRERGNYATRSWARRVRRLPRVIAIIVTGPAAGVTTSAESPPPPMAEPGRTEYSLAMIMPHDPSLPPLRFPLQQPCRSRQSRDLPQLLALILHLPSALLSSSSVFRCNASARVHPCVWYRVCVLRVFAPFQQNGAPALL